MFRFVALLLAVLASMPAFAQPTTGAIHGVVLEAPNGAPVSGVTVRVQSTGRSTATDADGRFVLEGLTIGRQELYVSAVDFLLVKQIVDVMADPPTTSVTISLSEAAPTLHQTVTVVGAADAPREPAAAEHALRGRELQLLRGLVTNDPFRAIQVLPGVATGDDLRSEFTVRGHAMDHMLFTVDGIAAPLLVHTVQRVVDSGSLAMVNGDVLEEVHLVEGAYPQRHGDRLGAELDFTIRPGARDRTGARLSVTGTDSALVAEGPLGSGQRGSWLASIRKSYLDLVTARLDTPIDFSFGFIDAQAKVVVDVTPRHQLQLSMAAGRSRLRLDPDDLTNDDPYDGRNNSGIGVIALRSTPTSRLTLTQRVGVTAGHYENRNINGVSLANGRSQDTVVRSELLAAVSPALSLEAGAELRSMHGHGQEVDFVSSTRFEVRQQFNKSGTASSAYALGTWTPGRWRVAPGVRVDYSTVDGATTASPWGEMSRRLSGTLTARIAGGLYRQQPTFDQRYGIRGTSSLEAERAEHVDAGIEGRLGPSLRWQATAYTRHEHDVIRLAGTEYRLVNNVVVPPSLTSRYRNGMEGVSHGIEWLLERRSANGLAGWVSYTLSKVSYDDTVTGEQFDGDYDQRHTVNAFGAFRFTERVSANARFRYGSNFPIPGYWRAGVPGALVSPTRNDLRLPAYARLDLRASRAFTKRRTRLTLFAEVLNVLNRHNVRASVPSVNRRTGDVVGLYDEVFPRVPSGGLLLEF